MQKAVEAYCLPLCRCSSGEAKENHVNISTVNVVDIPSGSGGYTRLETAVPPSSHIGESVLQLFNDAVSVAELG
jgi:hypothetical protein